MTRTLRFGSACTGVGGIDMGLERAGWQPAWMIESNPAARSVLRRHWPDVPLYEDLHDVASSDDPLPLVDLVAAGSPCVDWSVAGRRQGLDGRSGSVFVSFCRLLDRCPGAGILWENVPNVLHHNGGQDWSICLEGFTGLRPRAPEGGWKNAGLCVGPLRWCAWRVLDAQYFGVPQRRRRVVAIGGPRSRSFPEALLQCESLCGNPRPRQGSRPTPAAASQDGAGGPVAKTVTQRYSSGTDPSYSTVLVHDPVVKTITRRYGDHHDPSSETFLVYDGTQITSPHNRSNPKLGDPSPTLTRAMASESSGSIVIAFDAQQDPVSGPVPGAIGRRGSHGVVVHDPSCDTVGPRKFSSRELERLFGMDADRWDDHDRELSRHARGLLIGNSAVVPVFEWVGRGLAAAIGGRPDA